MVCRYDPPGNVAGQYLANVPPPGKPPPPPPPAKRPPPPAKRPPPPARRPPPPSKRPPPPAKRPPPPALSPSDKGWLDAHNQVRLPGSDKLTWDPNLVASAKARASQCQPDIAMYVSPGENSAFFFI
jgi:hypothetical protein